MKLFRCAAFVGTFLITFLFCSMSYSSDSTKLSRTPENIILMIGDGMGPAHIKALRLFNDDTATRPVELLLLDRYLLGTLATDPHMPADKQDDVIVTDSAASATAYSAGIKTNNGAIAVDNAQQAVETVLERAKKSGMKTGLVATSQIVHATPAAFVAHVNSRKEYNAIADQFLDNQWQKKPMLDLFLGGGVKYFKRDDRDLIKELTAANFEVVYNAEQLSNAGEQVAGLFAEVSIPPVLARSASHPSLKQMTEAALTRLDNDAGFFLMVEGSQIDWTSHDNNIAGALFELRDFHDAFVTALEFAQKKGNTLILVTADHETGGLSIGANRQGKGHYAFNVEAIRKMTRTIKDYANSIHTLDDLIRWSQSLGFSVNDIEQGKFLSLLKKYKSGSKKLLKAKFDLIKQVVNRYATVGWTTNGHTGVDVNIYGYGPGAETFRGANDNTAVGINLMKWLDR